jgi:hypothetical protein
MTRLESIVIFAALCWLPCYSFVIPSSRRSLARFALRDVIVSPFDESSNKGTGDSVATATKEGPFELTWENVEMVLDEMRPFLIQDGGNVAIKEIDGPVVKLELQVRMTCALFRLFLQ